MLHFYFFRKVKQLEMKKKLTLIICFFTVIINAQQSKHLSFKDKQGNTIDYELSQLPDWPLDMKLEGSLKQKQAIMYDTGQLIGLVWESEPGKIAIKDYPYDQITIILKGKLFLTDNSTKKTTVYKKGNVFHLPKGFNGIWEMKRDYKEFVVIEKKTFLENEKLNQKP